MTETAAPQFKLKAELERPQTSLRTITATVSCSLACETEASGTLRIKTSNSEIERFDLEPDAASLSADEQTELVLGIPAEARGPARRALRNGGQVTGRVRVRATEGERDRAKTRFTTFKAA